MHPAERSSVGSALTRAVRRLRAAGSPSPRLDAELLVAHVAGRERSWVLAHPEAALADAAALDRLLERRAGGEPVAYLRGFKEWRSLRIRTDGRALIPRPETELLADGAIAEIERRLARDDNEVVAWEVATGSGAVTLALALRFGEKVSADRLRLIATDLSADALDLAASNLIEHGVAKRVHLVLADLLGPAGDALPLPDVVVANLPYVPSAEVDERHGSLGFEPRIALDGGPDGLELLRRLLGQLGERAARGAVCVLEIGVGQAPAVRSLAPDGASVSVVLDLAGRDRVVRIEMPD